MASIEIEFRFYLDDTQHRSYDSVLDAIKHLGPIKIKDYAFSDYYFLPRNPTQDWSPSVQTMRIRRRTVWTGKQPACLIVYKKAGQEKEIRYEGSFDDLETPTKNLLDEGFEKWIEIEKQEGLHFSVGKDRRMALERNICSYNKNSCEPFVMGEIEIGSDDPERVKRLVEEITDAIGITIQKTTKDSMASIAMKKLRLAEEQFIPRVLT